MLSLWIEKRDLKMEFCENCICWRERSALSHGSGPSDIEPMECRRYPPTATYIYYQDLGEGEILPVVFPTTYGDTWCGEFKAK